MDAPAQEMTVSLRWFRESAGIARTATTVLAANPDLAKGRAVIACPMWKGYARWILTDDKVRNPFYGTSMLECGVEAELNS